MTPLRVTQAAIAALALAAVCPAPSIASRPALVDQAGHKFELGQLRGSPVVLTFISTRCTDACPLIDAQFAAALSDSRLRGVRFLTLTLDPAYDTPRRMRKLSATFDARAPRWIFASGSATSIARVMRRFGVRTQNNRLGIPEVHTTFVYIINPFGRLTHVVLASTDLASEIAGLVHS